MILIVAVTAVQRDGHGGLKNGGNSHRSRERIMQWSTRQYQSIFRRWSQKGRRLWSRSTSQNDLITAARARLSLGLDTVVAGRVTV